MRVLFVSMILLFLLSACDSGGGNFCLELVDDNNFLLAFQECPNDGIKQICNSFECTLTEQIGGIPLPVPVIINPADCSRIDFCFNLNCNNQGTSLGEVILTTQEILASNEFIGVALLGGGGPYDFSCAPILP